MGQDTDIGRIGQALCGGPMQPGPAAGCAFLLAAARREGFTERDDPALAYILATAFHETGGLVQPVRERGGAAYLRRRYDVTGDNPARARAHGNLSSGDGVRYAGRGYVQLPGRRITSGWAPCSASISWAHRIARWSRGWRRRSCSAAWPAGGSRGGGLRNSSARARRTSFRRVAS